MQEPFIMIPRSFFESGYWCQSRTFNDCEAILDIIQQVRFEATEHFARIGGREVKWGQAEWPASVRFLANRWRWTERRVRTFITSLKKNGIITTDDSQGVNVIRLLKFTSSDTESDTAGDIPSDTPNDTANALDINKLVERVTQEVTQRLTQERHSSDTNTKNGNNNIKNNSSLRSELKEKYDWSLLSDDMRLVVEKWLAYKREKNQAYKPIGFTAFCNKLIKLSNGDAEIANLIIEQSMSSNYSGIFELKNSNYGKTQTTQRANQGSEHPSDSELRNDTVKLIQRLGAERRARNAEIRNGRGLFDESDS